MILAVSCSSPEMNSFFYYAKNIMNIIMIVAPILAIVSLSILLFKLTMNPDEKKLIKNLENALKAMIIIFFIPLLVNIGMSLAGEKTNISKCFNSAQAPGMASSHIKTTDGDSSNVISDAEKYDESSSYKQLDFSCKSKYVTNFSCNTIHIVERHLNDFNYYTFNSVISSYGGFENYMKSLGGYFEDYYGKQPKVTTVVEFQKVAEYVFGMMTMYGFDYFNGSDGKYCKWGGNCADMVDINAYRADPSKGRLPNPGSSDAFYPGQLIHDEDGLSDKNHFDRLISNVGEINMTTNCNWAVDMVFYKAGIFGTGRTAVNSSASFKAMAKAKGNKVITDYKEVKVGDIMHFFNNEVDPGNPNTWANWYHTAFVGEVNKKTGVITVYDGGSRLTNSRSHKWTFNMKDKVNRHWGIVRVIDLK